MIMWRRVFLSFLSSIAILAAAHAGAATLHVGAASCDITPDEPTFLHGQHRPRVAKEVQYPVTANILALESREDDEPVESAIMISVDLCVVRESFLMPLREAIQEQLPGFDIGKTIVVATQTHTAPGIKDGYFLQEEGVMVPSEYVKFAVARIAPAVKQAWQSRKQARFSYGLDHAVVGYNRRVVYADGRAVMYGKTNDPNFRRIEGVEDHDVDCMFFWDTDDKLLAILLDRKSVV